MVSQQRAWHASWKTGQVWISSTQVRLGGRGGGKGGQRGGRREREERRRKSKKKKKKETRMGKGNQG